MIADALLVRRAMAAVVVAGAGLMLSGTAEAAASCNFSATGPAFGLYNPLNASPALANGSVTATCSWISGGSTNVTMISSYSPGNSGNYANRYMLAGTNRLYYNLYFDAAFTRIRGDGTGGSQTGSASLRVSRGQPVATSTSVIYGRIPARQSPNPGTYTDTILVTINY